jgi:hypothetical protein
MTGKEDSMEWKLIETKWEAMTRRIRADYPVDQMKAVATSRGDGAPRDAFSASLADSVTASTQRPEFKSSSK